MKATAIKSPYELEADALLESMGITFEAVYERHGKHFAEDTTDRDIYACFLRRIEGDNKGRELKITFGQSISRSKLSKAEHDHFVARGKFEEIRNRRKNVQAPTAYDILSCITKSEPGTFDEFCSDYGYSDDSIKANNSYKAVVDEWFRVSRFFTAKELTLIQEVQ